MHMSIEEWWGRTFEGRGSIKADQMPDISQATIQKLATADLAEFIHSEDMRSVRGVLCHQELRRRDNWTARAALAISVMALIISAIR